jgi:hypothetical protein
MSLIAFSILVLGFYLLYNTSKRAVLQKNSMTLYIQKYSTFSKVIGLLLLLVSFSLFIFQYGIGAGIFIAVVLQMVVSSLVILLFPLIRKRKQAIKLNKN